MYFTLPIYLCQENPQLAKYITCNNTSFYWRGTLGFLVIFISYVTLLMPSKKRIPNKGSLITMVFICFIFIILLFVNIFPAPNFYFLFYGIIYGFSFALIDVIQSYKLNFEFLIN